MMIDVCTTAMSRPKILDKTYSSFLKRLKGFVPHRCIINVDKLPRHTEKEQLATVEVAKKYFPEVIFNCTEKSNFPAALRWCLWKCESEVILQLQDDWELMYKVELKKILSLLKQKKRSQVVFRSFHHNFKKRFLLCPGFWRKKTYLGIREGLPSNMNPEQWIRKQKIYNCGIIYPKKRNDIYVRDLGRKYNIKNKIKRNTTNPLKFISLEKGKEVKLLSQARLAEKDRQEKVLRKKLKKRKKRNKKK